MAKYVDADLLVRKIKGQIRLENLNFAALGGGGQTFCTNTLEWVLKQIDSLQQEQQEVDLDKEMSRFIRTYLTKPEYDKDFIAEVDWENSMRECARYFYGLRQLNSK